MHQLVEVEYPSFVTVGKPTYVQMLKYDEERENAARQVRVQKCQQRILKHTGFRWIAEALAGGDLSELDPNGFKGILTSSRAVEAKYTLNDFTERVKRKVKENQPILVGHNLFADLVYFINCFFEPLPEKVEDFMAIAHKLFPVVMDTKYMATYDCGSINPKSSLEEINDDLLEIAKPKIGVNHASSSFLSSSC